MKNRKKMKKIKNIYIKMKKIKMIKK